MATRRRTRTPSPSEGAGRSLKWLNTHCPRFVRRDVGGTTGSGRDERLREAGIPVTADTRKAYDLAAKQTRDTIDRYLEPKWARLKEIESNLRKLLG